MKFFDKMDLFAHPLPTFNIQGATKVSSCLGFALSGCLYMVILGYAVSRLVVVFGDGNPTFSSYKIDSKFDMHEGVNLDEFGFQIAFQVERI